MELTDLHFTYGGQENFSLSIESLTIKPGDILFLHGRSGCGKSTLMNLMSGVIPGAVARDTAEMFSSTAYVMHDATLLPWATINRNLVIEARLRRVEPPVDHFARFCAGFELPEAVGELYPSNLSLGMRQRVEVAKALAFSCSLLCLDEAFSGIDSRTKMRVLSAIHETTRERKTAVISTAHQLADVIRLADRVCFMDRGKILREIHIKESCAARLEMDGRELLQLPEAEALLTLSS